VTSTSDEYQRIEGEVCLRSVISSLCDHRRTEGGINVRCVFIITDKTRVVRTGR
jgi:hypothetical protein